MISTKQKDSKLTFREAYKELEALVSALEKDPSEFDIDDALKKYERGNELAEFCKKSLDQMKNRVVEINKRFRTIADEKNSGFDQ